MAELHIPDHTHGAPPSRNTDRPWLKRWVESSVVRALADQVRASDRVSISGSRGSSTTLLTGALALQTSRPVLLVVAHLDEADDALDDLELFPQSGMPLEVRRFGALEVLPGESNISLDLLAERLAIVEALSNARLANEQKGGFCDVLVAPVQALMQAVPGPSTLDQLYLSLAAGMELAPSILADRLLSTGYRRVEGVEQPGEFTTRGGIFDIYPPAAIVEGTYGEATHTDNLGPIRLDYFGDEIESISRIDLDTLGSGTRINSVRLVGASTQQLLSDEGTVSLWSLLPLETLVVLHEVMELAEQARGYYERLTDPRGVFAPPGLFKALTRLPGVDVNQYSGATNNTKDSRKTASQDCDLPVQVLPTFSNETGQAIKDLVQLCDAEIGVGAEVVVLCQKAGERDRLSELIAEHAPGKEAHVRLEIGYMHRGFVWADLETKPLYLIPHHELFHRYHTRRRYRGPTGSPMSGDGAGARVADAFLDVDAGDHVVHVDHGIARFVGLRTLRRKGKTEEYLTLEFANNSLLHLPVTQIDLVQKYIGGFQGKPPLSTLGGKRWAKQKQQVAEAVRDLAAELLRVQAARASLPGIRYPSDTTWQREFEDEFPYDETDDQLAAIAAAKRDMGDEQPMDRLICGDVGFGKTEVAIRAAFKAVEFGKQVAVLVPTTVLAEQHERTFRQRLADYPFRVESISRFKTAGAVTSVLNDLERGKVDIVIGTHRLLSKDVKFSDLGLVIVDEEQRFGVEHKQRLMQFRLTVDVLTLTATPIPRTLHMSMLGLRDISSLSTAPLDRRAIVTEVIPFDEDRVRHAIIRELNRDGQVFFVHNRVHNIHTIAGQIMGLVPGARVAVGHGQMPGHELEEVMLRFVRHEADVLVCTTIIESGIDIPTANTMLINDADHFGLADLHQLRGRVGRYKHRAYCYLLLPQDRPVTDIAARRLKAVEQYSMLGAGFKIAMRDLEIRGAGNLLGAQQSGHIAAVGYDMYCRLLEHEARQLRKEQSADPIRTHLELPVAGRIPKSYIPSDKFRMDAYRRLSRAETHDELNAVIGDLTDAFGDMPPIAQTFVDLATIRVAAATLDIDGIKLDPPDLIIKTAAPKSAEPIFRRAQGRVSVIDDNTLYYRPPSSYLEPATLLAVLRKLLVEPAKSR